LRAESPPRGDSILRTSAPSSASISPAYGPATLLPTSITRCPFNGLLLATPRLLLHPRLLRAQVISRCSRCLRSGVEPPRTLTLVMDARKINGLTSGTASIAAGAALAARAQASKASGNLVESLLEGDLGTAGMQSNANPDAFREHLALPLADSVPAQVSGRKPLAPYSEASPSLPSANAQTPAGVLVTLSTQALDRLVTPQRTEDNGPSVPLSAPQSSPELRTEAYPVAGPSIASPNPSTAPVEPRSASAAISHARDAERLAGLVITPAAAPTPSRQAFDKLLLAAAILGALLLIVL